MNIYTFGNWTIIADLRGLFTMLLLILILFSITGLIMFIANKRGIQ